MLARDVGWAGTVRTWWSPSVWCRQLSRSRWRARSGPASSSPRHGVARGLQSAAGEAQARGDEVAVTKGSSKVVFRSVPRRMA